MGFLLKVSYVVRLRRKAASPIANDVYTENVMSDSEAFADYAPLA